MLDQPWIFPLLGIVVGVLAGLLGVGGGLILVGGLVWLLPLHGVGPKAVRLLEEAVVAHGLIWGESG